MILWIFFTLASNNKLNFEKFKYDYFLELYYRSGYKYILESMLFEKKSTDINFSYVKSYKKYSEKKITKNKYNNSLNDISEEESKKLNNKIYINLQKININPNSVYFIRIFIIDKTNTTVLINTKPFVYDKQQKRWIFSDKVLKQNEPWWDNIIFYNIIGILTICFLIYLLVYKIVLIYLRTV